VKVLVVSQYWHPENGVPQRRWSWLSGLLVSKDVNVDVVAPPPHYLRSVSFSQWVKTVKLPRRQKRERGLSGETIFRSLYLPSGNSLTFRAVNQLVVALGTVAEVFQVYIRRGVPRPDLVIGTVPALPIAVATYLISRVLRRPYWIDLRDAWPDLLAESANWNKGLSSVSKREKILSRGPLQLVKLFTDRALNYVLSKSEGIIVTSSELKADLNKRFTRQADKGHLIVIRNVFPAKTDMARLSRSIEDATLHVLYAGTLGRAQNLTNAIKAAEIVGHAGYGIELRFVGAGAAKESLRQLTKATGVNVHFDTRKPASALDDIYQWADTALVHLTNWEPLERAVPSKTYELMEMGIHISGVVAGEAASLIRDNHAGDVVEPESPQQLAALWIELIDNPSRLEVGDTGKNWVSTQRDKVVPEVIETLVGGVDRERR